MLWGGIIIFVILFIWLFAVFPGTVTFVVLLLIGWLLFWLWSNTQDTVPKKKLVVSSGSLELMHRKSLSKHNFDQVVNEYNRSVNKIVSDPNKSEYELTSFIKEFLTQSWVVVRISKLMTDIEYYYTFHKFLEEKKDGQKWESDVIHLRQVNGSHKPPYNIVDQDVELEYEGIKVKIIPLSKPTNFSQRSRDVRKMEVYDKGVLVLEAEIGKVLPWGSEDNYLSYSHEDELLSVKLFKPSEWLMILLNLAERFHDEQEDLRDKRMKESSQKKKEELKSKFTL